MTADSKSDPKRPSRLEEVLARLDNIKSELGRLANNSEKTQEPPPLNATLQLPNDFLQKQGKSASHGNWIQGSIALVGFLALISGIVYGCVAKRQLDEMKASNQINKEYYASTVEKMQTQAEEMKKANTIAGDFAKLAMQYARHTESASCYENFQSLQTSFQLTITCSGNRPADITEGSYFVSLKTVPEFRTIGKSMTRTIKPVRLSGDSRDLQMQFVVPGFSMGRV
jgi:hypothetical protein